MGGLVYNINIKLSGGLFMKEITEFIKTMIGGTRTGNIALGVMFVVIGLLGFLLLKLNEKRKNKNE